MREYDCIDALFLETLEALEEAPTTTSRDGNTRELVGWTARLTDPYAHFLFNPRRKLRPHYAGGEFLWYYTGSDQLAMISDYAPSYGRFSDDGETLHGAYGPRIWCSLQAVIQMLKDKPDSRQAVITLHRSTDASIAARGESKDIPCTIALQFLVRDSKLNLIVTMRSNDMWTGLPYDVFCFTSFQILMAQSLGYGVGWYQHQAASLHIYERHWEAAHEAVRVRAFNTGPLEYYPLRQDPFSEEIVTHIAELEEFLRTQHRFGANIDVEDLPANTLLGQCLVWSCLHRNTKLYSPTKHISDPQMKKYCQGVYECS